MCRRTGPCTMGNQTGKETLAMAAGHGEPPATSVDAAVSPDPGLCSERATRLLLLQVVQQGRRAAQSLQGKKAIRQKAHGGVVVKTGPGASLEVVQAQFLFELLIAVIHVQAALPQLDCLGHRRVCSQV